MPSSTRARSWSSTTRPNAILANPANEFVENFIGSGAGLKQLTLTRVNEVELMDAVTAQPGELASDVLSRVQGAGDSLAVVLDKRRRPVRRLTRRQLSRLQIIDDTIDESMPVVGDQATLNDALDTMLVASSETAVVTGRRDVFRGVINVQDHHGGHRRRPCLGGGRRRRRPRGPELRRHPGRCRGRRRCRRRPSRRGTHPKQPLSAEEPR